MENSSDDFSLLFYIAGYMPMYLFSMASIIYCCYFNAKALKSVETQK
jgi:hypothetical protein